MMHYEQHAIKVFLLGLL